MAWEVGHRALPRKVRVVCAQASQELFQAHTGSRAPRSGCGRSHPTWWSGPCPLACYLPGVSVEGTRGRQDRQQGGEREVRGPHWRASWGGCRGGTERERQQEREIGQVCSAGPGRKTQFGHFLGCHTWDLFEGFFFFFFLDARLISCLGLHGEMALHLSPNAQLYTDDTNLVRFDQGQGGSGAVSRPPVASVLCSQP